MIRLVIFDCDGVLTVDDSSWRVLHEYFGSRDNSYFARLYEEGLLSYRDWMLIDTAIMIHSYGKPITKRMVEEALSKIKVRPEAPMVFKALKMRGLVTGVVSSGVGELVRRVCRMVGSDICLYNELEYHGDTLIPGGRPWVPLHLKPELIRRIAGSLGVGLGETAYVGDSRWDIPVFKTVGLPIAVEPCGEACGYARHVVRSLDEVLDLL